MITGRHDPKTKKCPRKVTLLAFPNKKTEGQSSRLKGDAWLLSPLKEVDALIYAMSLAVPIGTTAGLEACVCAGKLGSNLFATPFTATATSDGMHAILESRHDMAAKEQEILTRAENGYLAFIGTEE